MSKLPKKTSGLGTLSYATPEKRKMLPIISRRLCAGLVGLFASYMFWIAIDALIHIENGSKHAGALWAFVFAAMGLGAICVFALIRWLKTELGRSDR